MIGRTGAATPNIGIDASHTVRLDEVMVQNFVTGIRVFGYGHAPGRKSLADLWRMTDVRAFLNEHVGIEIEGEDVNVGYAELVSVDQNCQHAARWPQLGTCAGLRESSFLGTVWVSAHSAGNRDVDTGEKFRGYDFDGIGQRSVCIGCYSENDQLPGWLHKVDIAIGGLGAWEGPGLWLRGDIASSLRVENTLDPSNRVTTLLGGATGSPGSSLALATSINNWPIYWRYMPGPQYWQQDIAGLGSAASMRVAATHGSPLGPMGTTSIPHGVCE